MAGRVLPAARPELGDRVQPELYRSMVETNTPVCSSLAEVRDALQAQRGQLAGPTGEASTEDLRLALRSYRQFVDRLLGLAS